MNKRELGRDQIWIRGVVQRHEGSLLRYAVSLTGNVELAREVVQETFLKLCRNDDPAQLDGHLKAWLFTVCRNQAIDVCRKESRMKTIPADQASSRADARPDSQTAAERTEGLEHIRRLMVGLSDNQQEVLRLKFQNGLSYREISEITKLSVSNVGYLLHTAIRQLRLGIAPSD